MALTPRSGFSNTTTGRNDIPNEIPNTQTDTLNNMAYVTDTNLNKYAIDTSAYPNSTKLLVGFMKGKRVLVTYYRLLKQGGSNLRANIADLPQTRNVLDSEYQKILNLEITLPKGFDFEADPTSASVGVTGEAMFYPNMNPNVGDIFLMGVGDGRIGLFQVSRAEPMTWRAGTIYTVKFSLQSFADASDIEPLDAAVTLTSVFQKTNFLGTTAALLSETTYYHLQKIKVLRSAFIKYYHQTFFSSDINSYLRPDCVYDPHAVQFMANKITMDDLHLRPKNLMGQNIKAYKQTIWARIEDRYNTTLVGVAPQARDLPYSQTRMGVFVTELVGYKVATPQASVDSGTPYVFSADFYAGAVDDMSTFERRFHTAITERNCGDLGTLVTEYLDLVYTLSLDEQYYKIPLYIHLIDMALQSQYREIDAPDMAYESTGD